MADNSRIEWTDATWNPVTGCSVVSKGCANCYAMRLAGTRLRHHPSRAGLTAESKAGPVWTGEVRFNEAWLDAPLRWKRPRQIFVCAHGDLFHEAVPDAWIDRVFAVMALAPQHTFQVLTKRAARMRDYVASRDNHFISEIAYAQDDLGHPQEGERPFPWPLPSVWLGVSAERQAEADARIPLLLDTPAALRWVSAEPLLGPVDLTRWLARLGWVVGGFESGPQARPGHPDWARGLRDQCQAAGVPFFWKQNGEWAPAAALAENVDFRDVAVDSDVAYGEFHGGGDFIASCLCAEGDPGSQLYRVGKKAAGALLDGREHRAFPQ